MQINSCLICNYCLLPFSSSWLEWSLCIQQSSPEEAEGGLFSSKSQQGAGSASPPSFLLPSLRALNRVLGYCVLRAPAAECVLRGVSLGLPGHVDSEGRKSHGTAALITPRVKGLQQFCTLGSAVGGGLQLSLPSFGDVLPPSTHTPQLGVGGRARSLPSHDLPPGGPGAPCLQKPEPRWGN